MKEEKLSLLDLIFNKTRGYLKHLILSFSILIGLFLLIIPLFFLLAFIVWIISLLTNTPPSLVVTNFFNSGLGLIVINFFKDWFSAILWIGGLILIVFPTIAWLVMWIFKIDLDKFEHKFVPDYFKFITIINIVLLTIVIIIDTKSNIYQKIWSFIGISIFYFIFYLIGISLWKYSERIEHLEEE